MSKMTSQRPSTPFVLTIILVGGVFSYIYLTQELRISYFLPPSPPRSTEIAKTNDDSQIEIVQKPKSNFSLTKTMLNIPEWYRTKDWGLRKDPSLETLQVLTRGWDKEELTSWNRFFFGTTGGLMLEMGAMNGSGYSVSYFYEEHAKWRSILIEANPILATLLPQTRPKALNFNLAICDKARTLHFQDKNSDGLGGIVEFMSEGYINAFHKSWLGADWKLDWGKVYADETVQVVQCVPLVDLLEALGIDYINFFILDVEGGELSILKGMDFTKIRFDVIAVETDRKTDKPEAVKEYVDAVAEILTRNGYRIWQRKVGRNSWFYAEGFQPFNSTEANSNNAIEPTF